MKKRLLILALSLLFSFLLSSSSLLADDKSQNASDRTPMKASFSDASGLDTEQDPVDYRTGAKDVTVRKAPDLQKSSPSSPFLGWLFGGFQNAAKKRQEQMDAVINGSDIPPPPQGSGELPPSPPPASHGSFFSNFFGGGASGKSLRDTLRDRKTQMEHAADDDYVPPPREPDTPPNQSNTSGGSFFSNFFGGRSSRSNQPPPEEPPSLAEMIRRRKEQIEKFDTGEKGDPLISDKSENKGNDPFAASDGLGVGGFMGGGSGGPAVDSRSMQEPGKGMNTEAPSQHSGGEGHHHHGPGGGDY